jgi:Uma2 family endonuclease
VSPLPSGRHGLIFARLQAQLNRLLPPQLPVTNTVTLEMTATGERYVPDLLVMHEDALNRDAWLLPAADAELVAEIVSRSNSHQDRVVTVRGYAASGVPVYLLVDPLEQQVTRCYEPSGGLYQQVHRVPFGAGIALPPPCAGKLDTSLVS